jgi:PAS domain S-box-containing protein
MAEVLLFHHAQGLTRGIVAFADDLRDAMADLLALLGLRDAYADRGAGLVVADAHTGDVVAWNPAAEALLGHRAADIVGSSLEIIVPERHHLRHRAGLARYGEAGRLTSFPDEVDLPPRHAPGEELVITVRPTIAELDGHRYAIARLLRAADRQPA